MADEAQQLDYLEKISTENAALEAEITRLTEAKLAETKQIAPAGTIKAPRAPGTGICVLDFGSLDQSGEIHASMQLQALRKAVAGADRPCGAH